MSAVVVACLVGVALVLAVATYAIVREAALEGRRPPRPHEREWCPRPALRGQRRKWWSVCDVHGVQGCHACITRDVANKDAEANR